MSVSPDENRCIHKANATGERCRRKATKGTTVCCVHGARAPQVKRAIAKKQAQEAALKYASGVMKRQGVDMDPAQHLVGALYEAQGMKAYFGAFVARLDEESQAQAKGGLRGVLQYSLPDDELDELAVSSNEMLLGFNRHGEAQIHPFVEQFNLWFDKHLKAADMCLKAGIAERKVKLAEEQGQIMVRIIRGMALELERTLGTPILSRPDFPAMVRRHLALGGGDVVDVEAR